MNMRLRVGLGASNLMCAIHNLNLNPLLFSVPCFFFLYPSLTEKESDRYLLQQPSSGDVLQFPVCNVQIQLPSCFWSDYQQNTISFARERTWFLLFFLSSMHVHPHIPSGNATVHHRNVLWLFRSLGYTWGSFCLESIKNCVTFQLGGWRVRDQLSIQRIFSPTRKRTKRRKNENTVRLRPADSFSNCLHGSKTVKIQRLFLSSILFLFSREWEDWRAHRPVPLWSRHHYWKISIGTSSSLDKQPHHWSMY